MREYKEARLNGEIKMTTKKQLKEELEGLRKLLQKYRTESMELTTKKGVLEREKSNFEFEMNSLKSQVDDLSKLKVMIVRILAGKASHNSKGEVLEDLMSIEIKGEREIKNYSRPQAQYR